MTKFIWIKKLIVRLSRKGILPISDEQHVKLQYNIKMGKKLNLSNPQTLNEKLQWLKLYDRRDIYTTMVDKYEAKQYVASVIGDKYIIPTLGVYEKFEDIDFDSLPNQFVIKCTHDSGGLVICRDKKELDKKLAKKKIKKALKRNYYNYGKEWPYRNVKPRIIIEKYLENNDKHTLDDFKIQMFNGDVAYSFVCTDRATGNVKFTFFDKNKKFIPVTQCGDPNDPEHAMIPKNYDKFVKLAKKLSKGIPELRVDFYDVKGKIYFGELTFFDSSGFGKFDPEEYDLIFGQMLDLKDVEK